MTGAHRGWFGPFGARQLSASAPHKHCMFEIHMALGLVDRAPGRGHHEAITSAAVERQDCTLLLDAKRKNFRSLDEDQVVEPQGRVRRTRNEQGTNYRQAAVGRAALPGRRGGATRAMFSSGAEYRTTPMKDAEAVSARLSTSGKVAPAAESMAQNLLT